MECAAPDSTSRPRLSLCPPRRHDNETRSRCMNESLPTPLAASPSGCKCGSPPASIRLQAKFDASPSSLSRCLTLTLSLSLPLFPSESLYSLVAQALVIGALISFNKVKGPREYGQRFESDDRCLLAVALMYTPLDHPTLSLSLSLPRCSVFW